LELGGPDRFDEAAGALGEVVTHEGGIDDPRRRAGLVVALPGLDANPPVDHDRVAPGEALLDVAGQATPAVHRVPGGLAVHPAAVAQVARRAPHPEGATLGFAHVA